eukprot:7972975-Pyramimonas_sp.AAC.1
MALVCDENWWLCVSKLPSRQSTNQPKIPQPTIRPLSYLHSSFHKSSYILSGVTTGKPVAGTSSGMPFKKLTIKQSTKFDFSMNMKGE